MLILLFIVLVIGLGAMLLFGSALAQNRLYESVTEKLPLRAVGAGAAIALYIVIWCAIDQKAPGKYGSLLEFNNQEIRELDQFDSVFQLAEKDESGAFKEVVVTYKKKPGPSGPIYVDDNNAKWTKNTTDRRVVALLATDESGKPLRLAVVLTPEGNLPSDDSSLQFRQGDRVMNGTAIGKVIRNKRGVLFGYAFINLLHLAVWVVSLWLILRYHFWHAFVGGGALWTFFTLLLIPQFLGMTRE